MNMTIEVAETGILAAYFTIRNCVDHQRTVVFDTCYVDHDVNGLTGVEILGPQDPTELASDLKKAGLEQNTVDLIIATLPNAWTLHGKV